MTATRSLVIQRAALPSRRSWRPRLWFGFRDKHPTVVFRLVWGRYSVSLLRLDVERIVGDKLVADAKDAAHKYRRPIPRFEICGKCRGNLLGTYVGAIPPCNCGRAARAVGPLAGHVVFCNALTAPFAHCDCGVGKRTQPAEPDKPYG